MLGGECCCWNSVSEILITSDPETFSLPSPLPEWPKGIAFKKDIIPIC